MSSSPVVGQNHNPNRIIGKQGFLQMRLAFIIIATFIIVLLLFIFVGCSPTIPNSSASVAPTSTGPDPHQQAAAILAEAQAKADAILAEANTAREEVKREKASIQIEEITERVLVLNEKIEATGNTELMISRFTVSDPEIFLSPEKVPTIRFTVKNGTDYPVARAYFHGVFKAKFREIPYAEGDFNYRIPGGLEPGEEAVWTLEYPPWITESDFPEEDATTTFVVDVVRIDNAHGEPILDRTHAKADLDELKLLQSKLAELKDMVPGYQPPPPPNLPEALPDPADTPSLAMRQEVTGDVYTLDNVYHVKRDCEALHSAIPGMTKADNARKRRMTACPKCIG